MKRAALWPLAWGLWLGALTAVQAIFAPKLVQFAIPAAASGACLATALALWAYDRRRGGQERLRLIADSSVATGAFVTGIALALVGAGFGLWLILIGAGVTAFGLGGIVREQRARGRAARARSPR